MKFSCDHFSCTKDFKGGKWTNIANLPVPKLVVLPNGQSVCRMIGRSWVRIPAGSYQRRKKWYLLPSCQALDIKRKEWGSKHGELPVDLPPPPTVALTAFSRLWPRDRRRPMRHTAWERLYFTVPRHVEFSFGLY